MHIHSLQHVAFEDLANIEKWAAAKKHTITKTMLFRETRFPSLQDFDWLVILGGPMNIYEEEKYSWLAAEKRFIESAIGAEKTVLGICLGAQLIADVLGGRVRKNHQKEIGWFPVRLTKEGRQSIFFEQFPEEFTPFHWHGDTFDIPPGAKRLAESKACTNQAFEYGSSVLGLQFHLESLPGSVQRLTDHCGDELVASKFIQTFEQMLCADQNFYSIHSLLLRLLENRIQSPSKLLS